MNVEKHLRESTILHKLISDKFYKAIVKSHGFIAGGAVRSVFAGEPIKDFDVFFHSKDDFDNCLKELNDGDSPTFFQTETAWSHTDKEGQRYQFIIASFGPPDVVIKDFDFTCCMAAWVPEEGFILDPLFLKHTAQRRLVFNTNAQFPLCSMWRAFKFVKRGYKLGGIECIKLALAIHHLDLQDKKTLKRQLLGIDTLFLKELTDSLAKDASVKYDFAEVINYIAGFVEEE